MVRGSATDDGQNMRMVGNGLTMQRHAIDPIADPELVNESKNQKYYFDFNLNNSVRCAANLE